MSFAYPEFLFALAAISIPVIIHLFNFRRFKKVYFSDIRFLKDVDIETKSRNKLKNLLILLSRILAIVCLVLAFAQPVIPTGQENTTPANLVVVYIDNSFSMSAQGEIGSLLEEAKLKAIEIGTAYASGAQLHLLTNNFSAAHYRSLSFEEFKNEVAAVQPSPQIRHFDNVLARARSVYDANTAASLYFISDLQENTAAPRTAITDTLLNLYVVPVRAEVQANLYVDSCWFESPSRLALQPDELHARIRNTGQKKVENVSVKLTINGIQRAVATTSIAANSYEDVVLHFTNAESGVQLADVSIQDYPITYDDRYYLSFNLAISTQILSINGTEASTATAHLFESEPNFILNQVAANALDYSALAQSDLVILNEVPQFSSGMIQELMKFVAQGGHLLFIPAPRQDPSSTNELLLALGAERLGETDSTTLKIEGVNLKSQIFKNVFTAWEDRIDLPSVKKYFSTETRTTVSSERLLILANGSPLLSAYRKQKGMSFILSTALRDAWTNLHRHALFVPTFYNIALNSVANNVSAEVIGSESLIPVHAKQPFSETLTITNTTQTKSFIPERVARTEGNGVYVHNQIQQDGHYLLTTTQGDTLQPISFNYNREESAMQFLSAQSFAQLATDFGFNNIQIVDAGVESLSAKVQELHNGKQLWRLFLILALLCLLTEIILIRIL